MPIRETTPRIAPDPKRDSAMINVPIEGGFFFVTSEGVIKKGYGSVTEEDLGSVQRAIEGTNDPEMIQMFKAHLNKLE